MFHPSLEKLEENYSEINNSTVIWLGNYDRYYCRYPEITAWKHGKIIRHHAPGLIGKYTSYLKKDFITTD
jgi:hypothetical protein